MNGHATGRAPACCKASAPQGGSPTEPTAMKRMEMRKINSYATVMKIERKFFFKYMFCFILSFRSENREVSKNFHVTD